jgi:hypothetical protein
MLSSLLKKYKKTCRLDLRFSYKVVYNDVQRADISLEIQAFNFDVWIRQQFGPSWQRARSHLPLLNGTVFVGRDSSIDDEKMRELLAIGN